MKYETLEDVYTDNLKSCYHGGIHKMKPLKKQDYQRNIKRSIYPKPFNSHKAFQRQKRGKR